MRQVVDIAQEQLRITVPPQWGTMPERVWDTNVWVADSRKIRQWLSWAPRFGFPEGLAATVDWFRANSPMEWFYRARLSLSTAG
jgi:nucleoside-diphosphate-sugar epimerase